MKKYDLYIDSLGVDKEKLGRIQSRLSEMTAVVTNILTQHNIPYFIFYGTLLGAVRHQGFIPWDDDFDMCIMDDVYDEAIEVLRSNLPNDMLVEDAKSEPLFFHAWARIRDKNTVVKNALALHNNLYQAKGLGLDLFRVKKMKQSEYPTYKYDQNVAFYKRKAALGIISEDECAAYVEKVSMFDCDTTCEQDVVGFMLQPFFIDVDDIFPLRTIQFEEMSLLAPRNYETILRKLYGNYMDPPPLGQGHIHFSEVRFL